MLQNAKGMSRGYAEKISHFLRDFGLPLSAMAAARKELQNFAAKGELSP